MHQLLHASRSAYRFYNLMTALSIIKTNKSNFNSEFGRLQPVFFHSDSMEFKCQCVGKIILKCITVTIKEVILLIYGLPTLGEMLF